jgi:DNA-binding transcriptional MerR regulator
MAPYSIGEAEEITGVKAHVLRYWEEVIPGIAPRKDIGGRRVYSERDIDLILRLKHLIYERKFTIEGARSQIISEAGEYDKHAEALGALREVRSELSDLYFTVRKYRTGYTVPNDGEAKAAASEKDAADTGNTPAGK